MDSCEIELVNALDELLEMQEYDEMLLVLKLVEGTFSQYAKYKTLAEKRGGK
jgi:hypothetical protein